MAPQLAADAPPPTTGVLTELSHLDLECTQITDAGCATLAAALDSGMLPALENAPPFEEAFEEDVSSDDGYPPSDGIPASVEAVAAVLEAMARQRRVARAQAQLGLPGPSYRCGTSQQPPHGELGDAAYEMGCGVGLCSAIRWHILASACRL